MEHETNLPNKVFRLRFPPLVILLCCAGLLLCVAGFAINTWQFVLFLKSDYSSIYDWMRYLLLYFASVFLAVLVISMLIKSQYTLTEKELIFQLGIIRSCRDIKKIRSVCKLGGSGKLVIYFDDYKSEFIKIGVREEWYDEFILALTARNGSIVVELVSAEDEQKPNDDQKK